MNHVFKKDLAPTHIAKSTKTLLNGNGVTVLAWDANPPDLNPIRKKYIQYGVLSGGGLETPNLTIKMTWRMLSNETGLPLYLNNPTGCNDTVIHAKGDPTEHWVHRNKQTFYKCDISVWNIILYFYWSYVIL